MAETHAEIIARLDAKSKVEALSTNESLLLEAAIRLERGEGSMRPHVARGLVFALTRSGNGSTKYPSLASDQAKAMRNARRAHA